MVTPGQYTLPYAPPQIDEPSRAFGCRFLGNSLLASQNHSQKETQEDEREPFRSSRMLPNLGSRCLDILAHSIRALASCLLGHRIATCPSGG